MNYPESRSMNLSQQHHRFPAPLQIRKKFVSCFSSGALGLILSRLILPRLMFLGLVLRLVLPAFVLLGTLGCETQSTSQGDSPSDTVIEISSIVEDLDGTPVDPVGEHEDRVRAFIFSRTDCPISRRYAPEVRRLCEKFATRDVKFYLVFPNPSRSGEDIRKHLSEFEYPCDAVRDPDHMLVAATGAKITPEAAVYDTQGELVYVGRIDDRFPKFGVARDPTTHELEDAILAALGEGVMPVADGPAIGCYISDLN